MHSEKTQASGGPPVVRPAVEADVPAVRALALDNGMFTSEDMAGFDEMLRGYLDGDLDGHHWAVAEDPSGRVVGAEYHAPEPFADRVWNLCFLAVHRACHRSGIGSLLLAHVEASLRSAGEQVARVLLVETSSTEDYEAARRFYLRSGFDHEATIREFYGPDDDKVVFWKSLLTQRP